VPYHTTLKFSIQNDGEIATVVNLVKNYYHNKDFAVITPYDAQRGEIEKRLKAEGLTWENSVFNVDSFQGTPEFFVNPPQLLNMPHHIQAMSATISSCH
jgi:hypothetical protein